MVHQPAIYFLKSLKNYRKKCAEQLDSDVARQLGIAGAAAVIKNARTHSQEKIAEGEPGELYHVSDVTGKENLIAQERQRKRQRRKTENT